MDELTTLAMTRQAPAEPADEALTQPAVARPTEPAPDPTAARHAALVAELCRHIEAAEAEPTLAELATHAGFSAWHLQRIFKSVTGLTPKAWMRARRAERVRDALAGGASVTTALHAAGYGSSGRFYAAADAALGMAPGRFRAGGAAMDIRFAIGQCSLGAILVAQSARGLCAIFLGDEPEPLLRDLQRRFPAATLIGGDADFERVVATVIGFVEAPQLGLNLPIDLRGTAFQLRVWQALRAIPPGSTASYADIAKSIGAPTATRAVAGACGANPVAVAVPCHRVVRSDGGLSGYRWGVERKRELLDRERAAGADAGDVALPASNTRLQPSLPGMEISRRDRP